MNNYIVIEGLDGCGKHTQTTFLSKRLKALGSVREYSFPNYRSDSSALVKKYLNGDFGRDADSVNPYAASTFFLSDQVATYLEDIRNGSSDFTVFDRYATSNLLYQAVKLHGKERAEFVKWFDDFAYSKLELPKPTMVIFLKVPFDVFKWLIAERHDNKHDGCDIHEDNMAFMEEVYEASMSIATENGWTVIDCFDKKKNEMRPIKEISDEIFSLF